MAIDKMKSRRTAGNGALRAYPANPKDRLAKPRPGDNAPSEADPAGQKQTGESLMASEVRYRRLFETAKDGILLLDADTGRITDVNPFLEDLLGYSHTELLGKALWEIGPVKDIVASQDAMRHLQHTEYIRYEDLPLETKSGQHLQVEFVSNVYLVDGFRVIQCNIRDITARKQAEARAETTLVELKGKVTELQRHDQGMRLLIHMTGLLQSCTRRAEAYQVIALTAGELFPGQNGCLAILDSKNQNLEMVARWGEDAIIEPSFPLKDCWALRRGQLHEVFNPLVSLMCRHFIHLPPAGYLCLPLTVQGETLGLLCLTHPNPGGNDLLANQQQLAVMVGEAVKLSLSNLKLREELQEQAVRDLLTGLFNRHYLEETLSRELSLERRRGAPLCVAMLDIDHFKEFNDAFGHGAGDLLLSELGRVLRGHLRESDILCRYGGDEFVLVMPDSSLANTLKRVEQIRGIVGRMTVQYSEQLLGTITLSAGLAQASEDDANADELLHAADQALYTAKQAGRDQSAVYEKSS